MAVRKHLLTELEILGAEFLQGWRADGDADATDKRGDAGFLIFKPTTFSARP